jgi:uncharacterized protein (TIGR02246 family)
MLPAEFMRVYEAAVNARDLEAALELIADDAVYLFSNQAAHVGKEAIRNAIQANFDTIKNETYRIQDMRWLAATEELAVCVYAFGWSGEINGQPASGSGRGTSVLRRIQGNWRVAHEHLSRGRLLSE